MTWIMNLLHPGPTRNDGPRSTPPHWRSLAIRLVLVSILHVGGAGSARGLELDQNLWVTNGAVDAAVVSGDVAYIGGTFTRVGPRTGGWVQLDPSTGADLGGLPEVAGAVYALQSDGNGGWFVGGSFRKVGGLDRDNLAHVDAQGVVTTWNPGTNGPVNAFTLMNGTLYVGGAFTQVAGSTRQRLAALSATTGTLLPWDPSTNGPVYALASYAGTVYIGGDLFDFSGTQRANLASVDGTTGAVTNWQPNPDGVVRAIALRVNVISLTVSVYVGGEFTVAGGAFRNHIALIDATVGSANFGSATSWNPNANDVVYALRVVGNTLPTVYVGGLFSAIGGQARSGLAAINGSGAATTWNPSPGAVGTTPAVRALALSGGVLHVAGNFESMGGQARLNAAAVDLSTGAPTAWNPEPNGGVHALATTASSVLAAGSFSSVGGVARRNLAALDLGSGGATDWDPGTDGPVYDIAVAGGFVYVAGDFGSVAGAPRSNVAQIGTDGLVGSWNPGPNALVSALAVRPVNTLRHVIYMGGKFSTVAGVPRSRLAAYTDDPILPELTSWNPGANGDVRALAIGSDRIFVGGDFTFAGGQPRNYLAAFDFAGGLTGWNPSPDDLVRALHYVDGSVYVGGLGMDAIAGVARQNLARLDAVTGVADAWNPGCNGPVYAIAHSGDVVYAGGLFEFAGGASRSALVALDVSTGLATSWNPDAWTPRSQAGFTGFSGVTALAIGSGRVVAGGVFRGMDGFAQSCVAGFTDPTVVAVEDQVDPTRTSSLRVSPNPTAAGVTLSFRLTKPSRVRVVVYDLAGRRVREIEAEAQSAGAHQLLWDGRNEDGEAAAPGVYVARLISGEGTSSTKIVRW